MDTLGQKIKSLRMQINMTQGELADKLGKERSTISSWETNRREPDGETLKDLAHLFKVSTDYLLGNKITATPELQQKKVELTKRDKREIEDAIKQFEEELLSNDGLMLSGEPASKEAVQSLIDAMRVGMELAKKRNKEKYTPNKYRKD